MKQAPELRALLGAYDLLRTRSEDARYDANYVPTPTLIADVRIALECVDAIVRGKLVARGYVVP